MLRIQTDLRGVRSDQVRLENELRAELHCLDGKVDSVDVKVDRLDTKVDAYDASNKARFDQVDRTMAINLEIMLRAYESGRR